MKPLAFASLALFALAATARADPTTQPGVAYEEDVMIAGASPRSMANDWIVPERGWQLGSALSYETSSGGADGHALAFTDVTFLRLDARATIKGRAEVYGGVDLLPKQPTFTDESVYEGAHAGLLFAIPHHLGIDARVDEGTLMDKAGVYGAAKIGLMGRRIVHEILAYQGELAGSWTPLRFDSGDHAWLAEVSATGSIVFRAPEGMAAAWVGFGFSFPIAHGGELPGIGTLDPQVRSDLRIGGVVSLVKKWDVYAEYAILDRGDYGAPRTMLPILDGGFDQRQLTIGLVRHFGIDRAPDVPPELAAAGGGSAKVPR